VLGVLPGVIGTIQATETIKLILGAEGTLIGRLLLYDAWGMRFRELKLRRDPECPVCGDHPTVREPQEFQICRIPGSTLIPLGQVGARVQEIEEAAAGRPIVVHCKMGARSAKAVKLLRERGIDRAQNLKGGILAWIDQIDPKLPKY
jgi:adenylyltransferase/sulfurtransferase